VYERPKFHADILTLSFILSLSLNPLITMRNEIMTPGSNFADFNGVLVKTYSVRMSEC